MVGEDEFCRGPFILADFQSLWQNVVLSYSVSSGEFKQQSAFPYCLVLSNVCSISTLICFLQAMIIMASNDLESPLQVFDAKVLEDIMSVFITSAVLKLIQG